MLLALLLLVAGALAAPPLCRLAGRAAAWWLALLPAAVAAGFATLVPEVAAGRPVVTALPWVEGLGVSLAFRLDGLSLLFALLVTGIGALVTVYAGAYVEAGRGRFLAALLAFTAAMLGLVLADDLLLLFVFWELTTVTSYLLVGHHHDRPRARRAALQALLVTGFGGLALLAGLLLLGAAAGSFRLGEVLAAGGDLASHPHYGWILTLLLLGAFTKSAQVPFHFWLPGAMEAPTPASAFLHSATMVKAGVYLLARLHPALGGSGAWTLALTVTGGATLLLAAWMAWQQTDLKKLLAYSTVGVLGTLTLLLGLGTGPALKAVAVLVLAHALYKAALFLVTGILDHETGTRDLASLGGLASAMPRTAGIAAAAALSMAGLPPLAGFLGKEVVLDAVLAHRGPGAAAWLAAGAVAVAAALTVAAALLAGVRPFFGRAGQPPAGGALAVHDPGAGLWLPPALLAVGGIAAGVAAPWVGGALVAPAAAAMAGAPVPVKLALWHGLTPAFLLGLTLLATGAALYVAWERLHPAGAPAARNTAALFDAAYDRTLAAVFTVARTCDRLLQAAPLSRHVAIVVAVTVVAVGAALGRAAMTGGGFPWPAPQAPAGLVEVALAGVILAASAVAVASRSRFAAVAALGAVGFAMALIFFHYGAPDLALTLLVVETLTVVLVALAFRRLPRFAALSTPRRRRRDAALAAGAGLLMALLVLVAVGVELPADASRFYAEASVPEGYGRNVVNVILVDFRALDTLGEIAVLGIAALGAYALLKLRPRHAGTHRTGADTRGSLILRTASRLLQPLLLLFSLFLLLTGHDEPGGGFVGGLVASAAFVLLVLSHGPGAARRALRVDPRTLLAGGLLLAATTGSAALAFGRPFLAAAWTVWSVPGLGELKVGTPLLFDAGVYLLVVGVTTLIVVALAEGPGRSV